MIVSRITPEHYATLKTWWERRNTEAPHQVLLPLVGVLAEDSEGYVACAWLYEDKAGAVAMVEWEATNPDASAMRAIRGLNMVFDFFERYCTEQNIAVILSWVAAGRGDGRLLTGRNWKKCPGERHELMAFQTQEAVCQQ